MSVEKHEAHTIYEVEALRDGWTVRQIGTPFYQRTLLARQGRYAQEGAERPARRRADPKLFFIAYVSCLRGSL